MRRGITAWIVALMALGSVGIVNANPGHGDLPPGLQKKAARGEPLPPGWKKKLQVGHTLDRSIYRHGVVISPAGHDGIATVRIEDETIRLVAATLEIVDILSR